MRTVFKNICFSFILHDLTYGIRAIIPCSPYMVGVRVSLKLEASEIFFSAKDRMAPESNHFNSFLRILENAISSGK